MGLRHVIALILIDEIEEILTLEVTSANLAFKRLQEIRDKVETFKENDN